MIHASLFSGIGGPEVAAAMLGWENAFHCEINPFGKQVLDYWFPESQSYEDITKTNFKNWGGRIDVLTGGFPCQPFSNAGKRNGANDNRYLWPEMLRVINEVRPTWVVGENVTGITTMVESREKVTMGYEDALFPENGDEEIFYESSEFTIERICRDLERAGYTVQPMLIPACAVGAPHRRDRIFFLAHIKDSECDRCSERGLEEQGSIRNERNACTGDAERICREERTNAANTDGNRGREVHEHLQSEQSDGTVPVSNGRLGDATDTNCERLQESLSDGWSTERKEKRAGQDDRTERTDSCDSEGRSIADTVRKGLERPDESGSREGGQRMQIRRDFAGYPMQNLQPEERWKSFPTVSPIHRGNDGIPFDVDCLPISFSKWREESLKAYGNAIVPQVMYEIFRAIEIAEGKQ